MVAVGPSLLKPAARFWFPWPIASNPSLSFLNEVLRRTFHLFALQVPTLHPNHLHPNLLEFPHHPELPTPQTLE